MTVKISEADRSKYFAAIEPYAAPIKKINALEKESGLEIGQSQGQLPPAATADEAQKRLALCEQMLNLSSLYIIQSDVSQLILGIKNEDALDESRRAVYRAIIYLESVVSRYVDVPFSDYEDRLALIAAVDGARRYDLVRKMGLAIDLLQNAYGENSKWKWSFVDIEGRFAAVAKNILDLKNAAANLDPRSPEYETAVRHLRMVKNLLGQAADRFRERYEISTNNPDDFQRGINFLESLRRILILLNEKDEAEEVKRKSDNWNARLQADLKKK